MDFKDYTLVELRQFAKERGAKNVSKMKKDELLGFLENFEEENSSENKIVEDENNILEENQEIFAEVEGSDAHAGYKVTNGIYISCTDTKI